MSNNRKLLSRWLGSAGVSVQDKPLTIHGPACALEAQLTLQRVEPARVHRQVEQVRNPTAVGAMVVIQNSLPTHLPG